MAALARAHPVDVDVVFAQPMSASSPHMQARLPFHSPAAAHLLAGVSHLLSRASVDTLGVVHAKLAIWKRELSFVGGEMPDVGLLTFETG